MRAALGVAGFAGGDGAMEKGANGRSSLSGRGSRDLLVAPTEGARARALVGWLRRSREEAAGAGWRKEARLIGDGSRGEVGGVAAAATGGWDKVPRF